MAIELSVVIPTFNERDNVLPLLKRLDDVLRGVAWEVIFVDDDSTDGTAALVRQVSQSDPRVRCIQRVGRRGLSSACVEGMLASSAPYVAVMDGDLQHDEAILREMLATLQKGATDIVIGSRYIEGGGVGEWSRRRQAISSFATFLSKRLVHSDLKDPMSGFFMLTRSFLERVVHRLTGKGFKILLDLLASSRAPVHFKEIPFHFRPRNAGASKLGTMVVWEYFLLLADKSIGRVIPVRFVLFVMVGTLGMVWHLSVLALGLKVFALPFYAAQSCAVFAAMTANFVVNNIFTYQDRKLHGRDFIKGLLSFYIACAIGALINVRVAMFLFEHGVVWWLSGLLGGGVGAVWNYAITSTFTWKSARHE
jgi:dolichol-phosphate mannosyltransferase